MASHGAGALTGAERIAHTQAVLEKVRSERARRSSSRAAAPSPARGVAQPPTMTTPQQPPSGSAMGPTYYGGEGSASLYGNQSPAVQRPVSSGHFSSWYASNSAALAAHGYADDQRTQSPDGHVRHAAPPATSSAAAAADHALSTTSWAAAQAQQQLAAQRMQSLPTAQPVARWQPQPTTSAYREASPQAPRAPMAATSSVAEEREHLQQLLGRLGASAGSATQGFAPAPALQPPPQPQPQQFEPPDAAEEGIASTSYLAKQFGEAVAAAARPAAEAIHSAQPLSRDDLKRLYDGEVERQLHAVGGDEEPRMRKAHALLQRTGSVFDAQKPVGVWGHVAAKSDLSKNDVVAIVELLEEQLAEREQRERALETALQKAKAAAAPAPPPTPAPAPAPAPPMEPEEVYDAPIHPAASIASLGRHLRDFCDSGGHMVSRHGLSQALRSLPDTDRAKRMENKVLRIFDGLHDEGGFGDSPERKLVPADSESQLVKLIVLIAHGERKEQINFALSAMNKKGLPPAVTSALAEETLAFAAHVFGDNPDHPRGGGDIDAAVKRCYSGVGQISLTEFRRFCYEDEFVATHCFGDTGVVDATAHLRNAAYATGEDKWGGIARAAHRQYN